ncbi:MAG: selenocysteine-specific translation elongation factor [Acidimicrobiales bacterium]
MHVVATAGHVDHGKSTLVRALTGMEPDRWAEERRRGMTIDLGYAWTTLEGGDQIAFVDVPGHQRFIGNMLAGVGPVPAVLLVIAADEGWCRQTTDHIAALDVLDVRHGVLAITRSDLGDPELAEEEAREHLKATSLADIEAVAVDGLSGAGVEELRAALGRLVRRMPTPPHNRGTRLWIDRVFNVAGAGTVVTGTLHMGSISVGNELELSPSGRTVRVRGLETLKTAVDQADAVARVAVNLRGVKPGEIQRGQALLSRGQWAMTRSIDVRLVKPAEQICLAPILHVGSAAVSVRVRRLESYLARLTLEAPLPLHVSDRGLLRDPGAREIAAGIIVLDTSPPALRRRGAASMRTAQLQEMDDEPNPFAEVNRRGCARRSELIAAGVLDEGASTPAGVIEFDEWLIDVERWESWRRQLLDVVDDWASGHALAPGIPRTSAVMTLGLPDERLVDHLITSQPDLTSDTGGIHRVGVSPTLPAKVRQALEELRGRLEREPFVAPEVAELEEAGLEPRFLATAVRLGLLSSIADGIYLLPDATKLAMERISTLTQPFTMSEARQILGTTRRVAVPLLEQLDRQHLTIRVDQNSRRIREPPPMPGSSSS